MHGEVAGEGAVAFQPQAQGFAGQGIVAIQRRLADSFRLLCAAAEEGVNAYDAGAGDDVFDGDAAVAGQQPAPEFALFRGLRREAEVAAFAGDLAMHWLARGGVYLAGGLAAKLLPHVDTQPFIDAFLAKREHRELVAAIPVHALTSEDLGLLGTLAYSASL